MLRLTALALLPLALLGACATPHIEAMARYGEYEIDGDVGISSTGVSASNSFDELGLDDEEGTAGALVDFKWGSPHLTVSTQSTDYDGDGTLETEISYDGNTIGAGADVATDLDFGLSTAALTFDLIPGPGEFGLGFGATYLDFDVEFVEDGTNETIQTDEAVPFPVLAVRGGFEFGAFEVAGLLSGMSLEIDEFDGEIFDLDLFGRWKFLGGDDHLGGSLVVGWRQVEIDADYEDGDDDISLDFDYSGPYVGLQIRF